MYAFTNIRQTMKIISKHLIDFYFIEPESILLRCTRPQVVFEQPKVTDGIAHRPGDKSSKCEGRTAQAY